MPFRNQPSQHKNCDHGSMAVLARSRRCHKTQTASELALSSVAVALRVGAPCGEHAGIPGGLVHDALAPCVKLPALQMALLMQR